MGVYIDPALFDFQGAVEAIPSVAAALPRPLDNDSATESSDGNDGVISIAS